VEDEFEKLLIYHQAQKLRHQIAEGTLRFGFRIGKMSRDRGPMRMAEIAKAGFKLGYVFLASLAPQASVRRDTLSIVKQPQELV